MRFQILIQKASLDMQDNRDVLIHAYTKGIKPHFAKQIIIQGPPTTLTEWMQKAAEVDGFERRANQFLSLALPRTKGKRTLWKLREYYQKEDRGEPMEINRLDSEQKNDDWKKTAECFNCGRKGHIATDCRSPKKGRVNQGNWPGPSNHKGKQREFQGNRSGGKKPLKTRAIEEKSSEEKAEEVRLKIRSIVSQAYNDHESEDYLHLIEQVGSMGFWLRKPTIQQSSSQQKYL